MKRGSKWLIRGILMTAMAAGASWSASESYEQSPRFRGGKFFNDVSFASTDISTLTSTLRRLLFEKQVDAVPARPIPLVPLTRERLLADRGQGLSVYRLGHSSLLLALNGDFWLVDPVFSERASPFRRLGPKRFHQTPIGLEDLPKIKGVIISHDHYDHLDQETILYLRDWVEHFVMPLGVGEHLRSWGVYPDLIQELDWWQEVTLGGVNLVATPAQHFSGRGLGDGNRTLRSSWVIRAGGSSLFYSGDSGYFPGFNKIGERFGPFDLTIMENGAYDPSWPHVHMSPEETLQAHLDLKGRALMPVHNSTFKLAFHAWYEPLERLSELAEAQSVPLVTPLIGERAAVNDLGRYRAWWRGLSETGAQMAKAGPGWSPRPAQDGYSSGL